MLTTSHLIWLPFQHNKYIMADPAYDKFSRRVNAAKAMSKPGSKIKILLNANQIHKSVKQ